MLSLRVVLALILTGGVVAEEAPTTTPCTLPEFSQFDFWVGEWDLTWSDTMHGTNVITKDFDGCVIVENFDGMQALGFRGMSISTYSPRLGKWRQTWVDNQGGYLDFSGEFKNGKMILSREAPLDTAFTHLRMVWHNISTDSLDWNWEKSRDNGNTWEITWSIHYARKQ